MRGISVIFLLINCYWFCYEAFHIWGFTLGIIDKILMNFQRTTGLFSSILWTKLFWYARHEHYLTGGSPE
ncbi:YWFCY motif protein [Hallella colorans]|uniref:YWFCY motif protein n=1 Tax=Hallella colorans TaxID=1703337 RepID=A0A2U0TJG8_9BACT|nr:YWFCY motif protein [Hallella colorans]